ncbi:MAG: sigma-70 family RNA polymerase sigma factor [Actinomycetota bacterium]|nr:sigma-70 family RNA polymerase sigma factor [Acidimicrobiia bacterium]MDQ3469030.1 sigma-70 family RNA polymerase sigma factor [Actinomycetota bacterium]
MVATMATTTKMTTEMPDHEGHPSLVPLRTSGVSDHFSAASDAALAMAVARYEQDALAEAYHRHAGAVFALARRLLNERGLAEEIVQEVFLRLWNDPTRFDPARGSMRGFLLIETHGRAVDLIRADSARRTREERDGCRTTPTDDDIGREVDHMIVSEQVRRSLVALPEEERQAIELAYYGGYTYREVAAQLGEPEGAVKSRIRAGLRRLHAELVENGVSMGGR